MDKSTISFICTLIQILCVFINTVIDNPYISIGLVIFQVILLIYQIVKICQ